MTKTKRCKTTGNKSLRQLLTQFLTIFENYKRIDSYILEDTLGKVCRKLGYKMDCFPGCQEAGLPEEFLRDNCDVFLPTLFVNHLLCGIVQKLIQETLRKINENFAYLSLLLP